MVTFYVIRHGETDMNKGGLFQGQFDAPLSNLGRKQAELVGEALSRVKFDVVYSSDLSRAAETARAIMKHQTCPLIFDRRLREINGGQTQGLSREEVALKFPEFDRAYREDPVNARRPGGESFADLRERVSRAIDDIYAWSSSRRDGATVAIVGHGGVIRCVLLEAGAKSPLPQGGVGNCSVTVLERDAGGWRIVRVGDESHLEGLTDAAAMGGEASQVSGGARPWDERLQRR